MTFCYQCGKPLSESANFCAYCGFNLEKVQEGKKKGKKGKERDPFETEEQKHELGKERVVELMKDSDTPILSIATAPQDDEEKDDHEKFGWVWIVVGIIILLVVLIVVWALLFSGYY